MHFQSGLVFMIEKFKNNLLNKFEEGMKEKGFLNLDSLQMY